MEPAVLALVKEHQDFFTITKGDPPKVTCVLNGHSLPAREAELRTFINGKKFAKLVAAYEEEGKLKELEPFIVPSKNFEDRLYCALTGMLVARNLKGAEKHMKGRRFLAAKARYVADEQELLPEPDLADDDEEEEDVDMGMGEGAEIDAMALDDVGGGMRDTTSEDDDGEDGVGPSGSWAEEEGRRGGEAFGRRTGAGPGGQGKGRPGSAGAGEPGQRGSASGGARSRAEGQGAGGKRKRITKQPKKKLRRDE